MLKSNNQKKIIVAMSGGLDSSVAAALLKRAGFNIIGVFMKFWMAPEKNGLIGAWNRCCSPEAESRARKVAKILNIPFYVFNFEKEFKKRIVDYFLDGYKKGITPNPCVVCNKEIKFGLLLEKTLALDADFVATGHYARLRREVQNPKSEILKLLRARDKNKDQSYFLWMLNQDQLKRILFPIGNYTKTEVKQLAKKFRLPVFDIPESMEICFIQITINDFLKRHLKLKPGKIVNNQGKVVGRHQGLAFYTIGQRKGIKLPGGPYYVLDKDLKKNALIITKNEKDLYKKELVAKNVNWISGKAPNLPLKINPHTKRAHLKHCARRSARYGVGVKAKIRYRHKPASAIITKNLDPKTYTLKFNRPQRAITPGQSVVFYSPRSSPKAMVRGKGQELLGGGIIC